jgi:hypothetical protein
LKNLLIIYPHWPPSNLAGIHRPRLIANFIEEFGWHPVILTVSPEYYEEAPDRDIGKTVAEGVEVIYTKALPVTKLRIIGDVGLRAFPFLWKAAKDLIQSRQIDFIWIPIPSFYTSLLGRILHENTAVPYGIDYIDPWVRDIHNRKDWRSKLSLQVAKWLEPVAVKRASLISGVSEAYYRPVIERNNSLSQVAHVGMPYGFDTRDHNIILENLEMPWALNDKPFIYAGAFLPNSRLFIKALFKVVKYKVNQGKWDARQKFYFIGTGAYTGTSILEHAKQFGIESLVYEYRERFPYLHVLNFLSAAHIVMTIGSTERHYTASKIYQALLSNRPIFAIFHDESSAVSVLEECNATNYLTRYKQTATEVALEIDIDIKLDLLTREVSEWKPDLDKLNQYSARASAKALVDKLNELV